MSYKYYPSTIRIIPPGKATGLLEPLGGMHGAWGQQPLLAMAPGFEVIPESQWSKYIDMQTEYKSALSRYVWSVFDQDGIGSCAAESAVGLLKLMREAAGLPKVEFNPWGTYYTSSGGVDGGSTLQENLRLIRDVGAHPEALHPRSLGFRRRPSDESYKAALNYRFAEFYEVRNWSELATALLRGWGIYWGYSGHAIVGCDLLNDRQFRYLNSWGNWGQPTPMNTILQYGFGVADRSDIMWGYGVYAVRTPVCEVEELFATAA